MSPSPLDFRALGLGAPFDAAGASVAALLLMRLTGLVWIAPLFSARTIPTAVRTAVLVLLTILLWPAAVAIPGAGTAQVTAATLVSELAVGLTLGLGAAIFVAAAEAAGDMLAVEMGLSGANLVDPMSQTQLPVVGHLLGLTVTMLILATGGHMMILGALHRSLEIIPPGAPIDVARGAVAVARLGGTVLALGLKFAAPVIAAMMVSNAALGILARTVPQLNVLMVAFPVHIAVGLFVLAATLPLVAASFGSWPDQYGSMAGDLLRSFALQGGR